MVSVIESAIFLHLGMCFHGGDVAIDDGEVVAGGLVGKQLAVVGEDKRIRIRSEDDGDRGFGRKVKGEAAAIDVSGFDFVEPRILLEGGGKCLTVEQTDFPAHGVCVRLRDECGRLLFGEKRMLVFVIDDDTEFAAGSVKIAHTRSHSEYHHAGQKQDDKKTFKILH